MKGRKEYFTKHVSRLIIWHIIKDACQFFSVELLPSDFVEIDDEDDIAWPTSKLTGVALQLSNLSIGALEVTDFPQQWEDDASRKRSSPNQGGRDGGSPGNWRGGGDRSDMDHGRQSFGRNGGGAGNDGRHSAPRIIRDQLGQLINEAKQINDRVSLKDILNAGDIHIRRLPSLPAYEDNGRSMICYAGLLGLCTHSRCHFEPVKYNDLSDDFVSKVVSIFGPALEKYIERGRGNRGGGNDGDNYYGRGGNRGGFNGGRNGRRG